MQALCLLRASVQICMMFTPPSPAHDMTVHALLVAMIQRAVGKGEAHALPSMDELLLRFDAMASVRKLGEGTFGEAYGTGRLVFKVLPLAGQRLVNGEVQKTPEEILAEAAITLALSRLRERGVDRC